MRYSKDQAENTTKQSNTDKKKRKRGPRLNYDVKSYKFEDLDLERAVARLPKRDRTILTLHLMGHSQETISARYSVSRSTVSKRMNVIYEVLKHRMVYGVGQYCSANSDEVDAEMIG